MERFWYVVQKSVPVHVTGTSKHDIPTEQRRGAILVLGMLADGKEFFADYINLMIKVGLKPDVC